MKRNISICLVTLVLALAMVFGVTVLSSAEDTKTGITAGSINLAENITLTLGITAPEGATQMTVTTPSGAQTLAVREQISVEIAAKNIAKPVTVAFLDADGNEVVCTNPEYSVADYIKDYKTSNDEKITGDADYDKFKALTDALTAYGTAADIYFDEEKTADTAGTLPEDAVITDPVKEGTVPDGMAHHSVTLLLESELTIRHYFIATLDTDIKDYVFYVDIDGGNDCDPAEVLTPVSKATSSDSIQGFYVDIEGITPNELDVYYKLCVAEKSAEAPAYSYSYSALNYVKNMYDKHTNPENPTPNLKTVNLVLAIYNYNKVASNLTGTVSFVQGPMDKGTFSSTSLTYEYGVGTPIVNPVTPTHELLRFAGWYDAKGNLFTEIDASMTGDITLYAWYALFDEVFYDLSKNEDSYWMQGLCLEHKDSDDEDALCDLCGRCIAGGCAAYDKTATEACAVCGLKGTDIVMSENAMLDKDRYPSNESYLYEYILSTNHSGVYSEGYYLKDGKLTILGSSQNTGTKGTTTNYGNKYCVGPGTKWTTTELMDIGIKDVNIQYNLTPYDRTKVSENIEYWLTNKWLADPSLAIVHHMYIFNYQNSYNGGRILGNAAITGAKTGNYTYTLGKNYGKWMATSNMVLYHGSSSTTAYFNTKCGPIEFNSFVCTATSYDTAKLKAPCSNEIVYEEDVILPESAPKSYTPGTVMQLPSTATNENPLMTFEGWYADAALTQPIKEIPANAVGNFQVYAKWKDDYISYHTNGTEAIETHNYDTKKGIQLPTLTRDGFRFVGWYDNAQLTGNALSSIPKGTTGPVEVYARWELLENTTLWSLAEQPESMRFYGTCLNHVDNDADDKHTCDTCGRCMICACGDAQVDEATDGVCDVCGLKTEKTSCAGYDYSATEACGICGMKATDLNSSEDSANYIYALGGSNATNGKTKAEGYYNNGNGKIVFAMQGYRAKWKLGMVGTTVADLIVQGYTNLNLKFTYRKYDANKDVLPYTWSAANVSTSGNSRSDALFLGTTVNYNSSTASNRSYNFDLTSRNQATQVIWYNNNDNHYNYTVVENFVITATPGNADAITYNEAVVSSSAATHNEYMQAIPLPETATHPTNSDLTFAGWYLDAEYTQPVTEIPAEMVGAVTVYAKWVNYNVLHYNTNGGDALENETYVAGVTTLKIPTRDGYNFIGWYDNAEFEGDPITVVPAGVSNDYNVYARWSEIFYVTYHSNGGTEFETEEYIPGTTVLKVPEKDGYTFFGWYDNAEFEGDPITTVSVDTTGDFDVYAKWLNNNHVLFNTAGGDKLDSIEYVAGETMLPAPTRDGFRFVGWYNDVLYSGEPMYLVPAETEGAFEVYARWEAIDEVVIWSLAEQPESMMFYGVCLNHLDSDSDDKCDTCHRCMDPSCVGYDYEATEACPICGMKANNTNRSEDYENYVYAFGEGSNPTNGKTKAEGYYVNDGKLIFAGKGYRTKWEVGMVGTQIQDLIEQGYTNIRIDYKNRGYDANQDIAPFSWSNEAAYTSTPTYYVYLLGSEGTLAPYRVTSIQQVAHSYTFDLLTMPNKSHEVKWHTYGINHSNYLVIEDFTVTAVKSGSDAIIYTGAIVEEGSPTHNEYMQSIALPTSAINATNSDLIFRGWYLDEGFTQPITEIPATMLGKVTLYPKWDEPEMIIYDTNNADQHLGKQDYVAGETELLPLEDNEFYTFGGWYDNPEFNGDPITAVPSDATGYYRVYAKWNEKDYIVYNNNGGEEMQKEAYIAGQTVLQLPAQREGYTFLGWYDNPEFEGDPITTVPSDSKGFVNVYAYWVTENHIIYNTDGGDEIPVQEYVAGETTLATPTKEGYTFLGWYDNADFEGDKITVVPEGTTGEYIVYAKWIEFVENETSDFDGSIRH